MASRAFGRVKLCVAWFLAVLVVLWWVTDAYILFCLPGNQAIVVGREGLSSCYWMPPFACEDVQMPEGRGSFDTFKGKWMPSGIYEIPGSRLWVRTEADTIDGLGYSNQEKHEYYLRWAVSKFETKSNWVRYVGPVGPVTFSLGRLHYVLFTADRLWQWVIGDTI